MKQLYFLWESALHQDIQTSGILGGSRRKDRGENKDLRPVQQYDRIFIVTALQTEDITKWCSAGDDTMYSVTCFGNSGNGCYPITTTVPIS